MHLSKRVKVVAGVSALLGLVMAGGAAFTATGIDDSAWANQFLGGTVTQNVYGLTLSNVAYTLTSNGAGTDGGLNNNNEVDLITLTFGGTVNDLAFANTNKLVPSLLITLDDTSTVSVTCEGIDLIDSTASVGPTLSTAYCDVANVANIASVAVTIGNFELS
jgi:hypothetical protein